MIITFACVARCLSFEYVERKQELIEFFLFLYLDSVDVNGDEYQNIEIPTDTISHSADTSTMNIDTNNSNPTDSLNLINEVRNFA
jgi:hypothetical protein